MPAIQPPPSPAAIAVPPGYAEVRRLDLKAAFHTKRPWLVYALAPRGPDAATGDKPVQICFADGGVDKPECTSVTSGLDDEAQSYAYQTLGEVGAVGEKPDPDGLKIELLTSTRRAVTATATFSGGGPGALTQRLNWTYLAASDSFVRDSAFKWESGLGEGRRIDHGPLAGWFVTAEAAWGADETRWDPHRFTLEIYRPGREAGYLKVLSYVTARKYPAERQTPGDVVGDEQARLQRLVRLVYPGGPPS